MFTVYILYDEQKDRFYVGQTEDLTRRLQRHAQGRSTYTRRGNWKLVFSEVYSTREQALMREKDIKRWKSKKMIKNLIGDRSSAWLEHPPFKRGVEGSNPSGPTNLN